jgi:hypothetical protein
MRRAVFGKAAKGGERGRPMVLGRNQRTGSPGGTAGAPVCDTKRIREGAGRRSGRAGRPYAAERRPFAEVILQRRFHS